MTEILAQGDILFERVTDTLPTGIRLAEGAVVLAEGEATGHRHQTFDQVAFFRDDGLARDIPGGLYIGHVRVTGDGAQVRHDEHDTITLTPGQKRSIRLERSGAF
jgi:pyrrolidone-carboxylate peptidase